MDQLAGGFGTISRCENKLSLTSLSEHVVLWTILIAVSVSSNDNWLGPAGNESWNVADNNWFSENSSVKNVSDCSVRWLPHLLQIEFFNSLFIWCDSCAFDSYFVLFHSFRAINSDLIVRRVTILNWQVVVLSFEINIGVNVLNDCYKCVTYLFFDPLPDYLGHLVTIDVDDCSCHLYFLEGSEVAFWDLT